MQHMNPHEALQYLSQLATDFARGLPPSAQAPTVNTANAAIASLAQLLPNTAPPRLVTEDGQAVGA